MGQIDTYVTVTNPFDPATKIDFRAIVDTGAFGLTLPASWKRQLEPFDLARPVLAELADQSRAPAEICGPVSIRLQGFPTVSGEVVFMDVEDEARFEPLVGCMVLEAANAVVDMLRRKLFQLPTYSLKPAAIG